MACDIGDDIEDGIDDYQAERQADAGSAYVPLSACRVAINSSSLYLRENKRRRIVDLPPKLEAAFAPCFHTARTPGVEPSVPEVSAAYTARNASDS